MPRGGRTLDSSPSPSVFVIAGILLLLVFAKVVLIPLAFAITLSFLLAPAVARLEKWGLGRAFAVALMSGLTCICIAVGALVLSRQVLNIADTLPDYRVNIDRKMATLHSSSARRLEEAFAMIEDLASGSTDPQVDALRVQVVGRRSDQLQANMSLLRIILEPVGQFGLVVIFSIYMLMNREDLRHRLLLLAGMGNMNVMTQALDDATARISQYLVMQLKVNACYGIVFGLGLYLLHVPQATLWGVIAGTLRLVPYVGTLMGMLLPLSLSIAASSSWWSPVLVIGLFLLIESTLTNLIEPVLFSSRTGISSLALLTSAVFWSMIWGLPGLVLSTPLTVCVVVLGQRIPQLSFLHSLLGTNATLSPAAHVYERLLAMDQTEALAVAEEYLAGKPLSNLYDTVVLPVLALAEEDRHKGVLNEVGWKFVLLSVGELVARLSEYALEPRPSLKKEFAVICISAGDQAAELATSMLGQLLEGAGFQTLVLGVESMSEEVLRGLSAGKNNVIILSALPPFAFAQTRTLCQRVRLHMPDNRIAVALWTSKEDADDMLPRFGTAHPEAVISNLVQALAQVESWRQYTRKN